jgi:recombinational DNA repair protein RecR
MEEFLKGVMVGALVGAGVAAVVVSKNKKLSSKIKNGVDDMQEKLAEAKDSFAEKLQDCDVFEDENNCGFCGEEKKNKNRK